MSKLHLYIIAIMIGFAIFLTYLATLLPDGQTHVFFLNVGQGDAALIRSPLGHNLIVDGGPGTKIREELSAVLPFYERQIDLLILTHPDQDHIEGAIEVLKNYQVKKVLFTGIISHSPFYQAFLEQVRRQNIPFLIADSSIDFRVSNNLYLDIIYPFTALSGQQVPSPNNTSIIFNLISHQKRILFTGDIEKEIEAQIVQSRANLSANILKVAHHGSKTSSSKQFLQKVHSNIAIIQSKKGNRHGHPHRQILDRLQANGIKQIYRNDLQGRLEVIISQGNELSVKMEKTPDPNDSS